MSDRGQLITGGVLLLLGIAFLVSNLFQINLWRYFWPLILIGLGFALLLRPRATPFGGSGGVHFLADVKRREQWVAEDENLWIFIGDVDLDFRHVDLVQEETVIRVSGFVGQLKVWVPAQVGVSLASQAFVSDVQFLGRKHEQILVPIRQTSDNFGVAEKRVRVEAYFFVADVDIHQDAG